MAAVAAAAAVAETRLVASLSPSPILHAPLNMTYHILVSFHNIMECILCIYLFAVHNITYQLYHSGFILVFLIFQLPSNNNQYPAGVLVQYLH